VIDSETLCRLLGEAEDWDQKTTTLQGVKKPRPFKRKWREKTPPEELRSSDEEKFKEAERWVRRKSEWLHLMVGRERLPNIIAKARFERWYLVCTFSLWYPSM
jgi:hypothetical protein